MPGSRKMRHTQPTVPNRRQAQVRVSQGGSQLPIGMNTDRGAPGGGVTELQLYSASTGSGGRFPSMPKARLWKERWNSDFQAGRERLGDQRGGRRPEPAWADRDFGAGSHVQSQSIELLPERLYSRILPGSAPQAGDGRLLR